MAQAPLQGLRQTARLFARGAVIALAGLALVSLSYFATAWLGSSIARNSNFVEATSGVTIMVETNGAHTGIVVPVANSVKDWRDTFPSAARPSAQNGELPTHLAIGWGESEVFLNVATWDDLTASTALRIAFLGGDPLMRVSHYVRPAASANYRPLTISEAQYKALVDKIEESLPPIETGEFREELWGTYALDTYYPALGRYTLAQTCNSWVGDTLAASGIAMGRWTPMAGGVMKWIKPPGESS